MIRVFPQRTKWTPTDGLAFIGDPPLFRPMHRSTPVRVSVAFSWDIAEGNRLASAWSSYYDNVKLGGPAFGDPGDEFVPGRFVKPGVVITSRGCPNACPWCYVPEREGELRELPITDGYIIQDNNLLACSNGHFERVIDMLRKQSRAAVFSGGLDASLFTAWHRSLLDTIRFKELWFACDSRAALDELRRVADLLGGVPTRKRRCYVLIGFDGETLIQAEKRLREVYELGFLPFSQLYRDQDNSARLPLWVKLNRKWSRPAIYRGLMPTRTEH